MENYHSNKISVIGSGSWGTALAQILLDNGFETIVYGINESEINDLNNGYNKKYFGDLKLSPKFKATTNLQEVLLNTNILILAVPSVFLRDVLIQINNLLTNKVIIVNVAKGLDPTNNERLSKTIRQIINEKYLKDVVSLIGPSHAEEVIKRIHTNVCAVSLKENIAIEIQRIFSNNYFRVYTLQDEIGAEYAASIKNVIAIASGIISGLGLGDNTKAALITRGLAEMTRFGVAKGAKLNTYLGLTGLGDLVVTCASEHSRNFQAGFQIGKDNGATKFLEENKMTVEGIRTCKIINEEAKKMNIEMPITNAVYEVLFENKRPSDLIEKLMMRSLKNED